MTWIDLLKANHVTAEPPSKQELDNLRSIAALRFSDLSVQGLSHEQRFIIAYDAARSLSTMIVRASGYRPKKLGGHYNTFIALEAADTAFAKLSAYFNTCRMKRNDSEYDFAGAIATTETDEIVLAVQKFATDAEAWISARFPAFAK